MITLHFPKQIHFTSISLYKAVSRVKHVVSDDNSDSNSSV